VTLNDEARADAAISDPDLLFTSIEAAATQQGAPRCHHHSRARGRRAAPHTHRSAPLPPHTLAVNTCTRARRLGRTQTRMLVSI